MKWACVSVAFLALCSIGSVQATAQVTAADSAAVLVRTTQRFEAQGDFEVARALYRYVVEHFTQTPAGSSAAERLSAVRSMGTRGSGNTELQVWSTLFGLYLGVAVPTRANRTESVSCWGDRRAFSAVEPWPEVGISRRARRGR